MSFKQPELPYDLSALTPFLSEEAMDYHFNKHHAAYFKNLNNLVQGKKEEQLSLEEIIKTSSGGIFNNAAQAWNHVFFWNCMSSNGGGHPKGDLKAALDRDFGSADECIKKFSHSAATLFGSGWAWLASDHQGKLEIMSLSNGENPIKYDKIPILGLDVWEHSYYIDYRNDRPRFIEQFKEIIHWDFVEKCYQDVK